MPNTSSTKPNQWTLSPQMTAYPNIWANAGFVLPLWEGLGKPRDILRNRLVSEFAGDNPGFVLGEKGYQVEDLSNGEYHFTINDSLDFADDTEGTMMILLRAKATTTTKPYWSFDGGDSSDMVLVRPNGSGTIQWFLRGSTDTNGSATGTSINDGDIHMLTASGGPDLGFRLLVDDELVDSDPATQWFSNIANPNVITLNGWVEWDDDTDAPHEIIFVAYFTKQLCDSVVGTIANDPFAMLRPAGF